MLAIAVLLADLMCKVHGSSSFHVSKLHTQAAVVVLAGLQLGSQGLAVLLQLLHLRFQLCQLTCRSGPTLIGPTCLSIDRRVQKLSRHLSHRRLVNHILGPNDGVLTGTTTHNCPEQCSVPVTVLLQHAFMLAYASQSCQHTTACCCCHALMALLATQQGTIL